MMRPSSPKRAATEVQDTFVDEENHMVIDNGGDELGVDVFSDKMRMSSYESPIKTPTKTDNTFYNKFKSPMSPMQVCIDGIEDVNLHDNDHPPTKQKRYNTLRAALERCWERAVPPRRRPACKLMLIGVVSVLLVCIIVISMSSSRSERPPSYTLSENGIYDEGCLAALQHENYPVQKVPPHLLDILGTVTEMNVLQHPCSLQHQALMWLWHEQEHATMHDSKDEESEGEQGFVRLDLTGPVTKSTVALLQDRYGVLVMSLALQTEDYAKLGVHTCSWVGVQCEDGNNFTHQTGIQAIRWPYQGLKGRIPNEIRALSGHLRELDLADNQITGMLPDGLFECTHLQRLYLHSNRLTGSLPEKFFDLKHLTNVYLGDNNFYGTIPHGMGSGNSTARPLRYLSLYKNNLTGSIPRNMNWRLMYWLDLSRNHLTGTLPTDWSEGNKTMPRLSHLFVNDNQLTGEIPASYPRLGNGRIEMFHVGNNRLTGTVPGGYSPVNFIQSLEYQGNNFTALTPDICGLIVFLPPASELVNLKLDCDICTCEKWCEPGYCYEKRP